MIVPDLAPDDAEKQQHRQRIHPEQRDDDVVGRVDRGQAGEHDEGRERRQQGDADRRRPDRPVAKRAAALGPCDGPAATASPTVVITPVCPDTPAV